jgi:hypothetical protein
MMSTSNSDSDSEMEFEEEDENSQPTQKGGAKASTSNGKLSKRAELFFDQPDFDGIDLDDEDDVLEKRNSNVNKIALEKEAEDDDFEIVPSKEAAPEPWSEDDSEDEKAPQRQGKSPFIGSTDHTRHRYRHRRSNDASPPNRHSPKNQKFTHRRLIQSLDLCR